MHPTQLYQSVLRQLSLLPIEYLRAVEQFLADLNKKLPKNKEKNRQAILAFAGSWKDLSDEDFEAIRQASKESGHLLFAREIDL